jgi:hypothetical protein
MAYECSWCLQRFDELPVDVTFFGQSRSGWRLAIIPGKPYLAHDLHFVGDGTDTATEMEAVVPEN